MPKTNLHTDLQLVGQLNHYVQALQQVATMQMRRHRDNVLHKRQFIEGLADIFIDVRLSQQAAYERYQKRHSRQVEKKPPLERRALVLLTPQAAFSRGLARKLLQAFEAEITSGEHQVFVVGNRGRNLFERTYPAIRFHFIPETSFGGSSQELAEVLTYDQITVCYPEFKNLTTQTLTLNSVTGDFRALSETSRQQRQERAFLFEPDLERTVAFFKQNVEKTLLSQRKLEALIAELGNRITNLERSQTEIKTQHAKLQRQLRRYQKTLKSKKQRERLAGRLLWNQT